MSIIEYLVNRELGRKIKWTKFGDAYNTVKDIDWRYNYFIIKLNNSDRTCSTCLMPYKRFIIDIDDMIDTFGFRYHIMYEPWCSSCEGYKYKH